MTATLFSSRRLCDTLRRKGVFFVFSFLCGVTTYCIFAFIHRANCSVNTLAAILGPRCEQRVPNEVAGECIFLMYIHAEVT